MIIFDIETRTHPRAKEFVTAKAPANYKDPTKIAEYVAQKTREQLENAALDPDLCSVRAIGVIPCCPERMDDTFIPDPMIRLAGLDPAEEKALIEWFFDVLYQHAGKCIGYNILGFDFPVLFHRALDLGMTLPLLVPMSRYRTEPVRDLYAILNNWQPGRGLKWVCERFGIERKTRGMDGSMVADMDDETLTEYLLDDLQSVYSLHEKMRGIYF
jgi:predicted PolB exonuclease-like 3'-5' exonuclease